MTVLPVDADGVVAPEAVNAIRPDTVLVSIMAANEISDRAAGDHRRGLPAPA
ncbi:MAG: hypothetical protein ACLUI3_10690 [Christensenellales bacterium]